MKNREIKFRAFHEQSKQMFWFDVMWGQSIQRGGGYIGMVPFGQKLVSQKRIGDPGNKTLIDPTECYLMQFTGLKDKNGKEIYDGDILKIDNWSTRFKIIWDDTFARFLPEKIGSDLGKKMDYIPVSESEIIGNIYENHELLTAPSQAISV